MNKQKFAKALFDFFCTQDCEDLNEQFKICMCELDDDDEINQMKDELQLKCEQLVSDWMRQSK